MFDIEYPYHSLFFNKVAGLKPTTLLKKRLCDRHFPMNFAKFLRVPIFTEHLQWMLLIVKLNPPRFYQAVQNRMEFLTNNRTGSSIYASIFTRIELIYTCLVFYALDQLHIILKLSSKQNIIFLAAKGLLISPITVVSFRGRFQVTNASLASLISFFLF